MDIVDIMLAKAISSGLVEGTDEQIADAVSNYLDTEGVPSLQPEAADSVADAVIGAPGFQEQINQGVAEYFDGNPPFFELPSGGQSGQALLSDGNNGARWGDVQSGGTGLTEDAKQALLDCFENVAWINDQGQTYYDALYAALYPPKTLVSISAVFNQGSAVIYDTDSLDTLRQYLTVTARYDDSTSESVANYILNGALSAGINTITVLYGGKSTTFLVSVTQTEYYTNPNNWFLNKSFYFTTTKYGTPYNEVYTDLDARAILKNPVRIQKGATYQITCNSGYSIKIAFFDEDKLFRGFINTDSLSTIDFISEYDYMGIQIATPSTATNEDIQNAGVHVEKTAESLDNLAWLLNTSIYTNRTNEPFSDIQGSVDARMLLTSLIPLESNKTYTVYCNNKYKMYCLMIDAEGKYQKAEGNTLLTSDSATFTNSDGYSQMSIIVKTPSTATSANTADVFITVIES